MPRDNAMRVVTGAKALSPNLGERMMAARLLDKEVVVRELMPQDLKIEIDRLTCPEAMSLARYLAGVIGRAHGRQMSANQRRAWCFDLTKNHKASLEAPSWLWTSVVGSLAYTRPPIWIIAGGLRCLKPPEEQDGRNIATRYRLSNRLDYETPMAKLLP